MMRERFGLTKQHQLLLIGIGLVLLLIYSASTGYSLGKDMAIRDNAREVRVEMPGAQ